MATVYSVKYLFTEGITEQKAEINGSYAYYTPKSGWGKVQLKPNEWSTDRATAIARAEALRARKIMALKRQISKIEKMKW